MLQYSSQIQRQSINKNNGAINISVMTDHRSHINWEKHSGEHSNKTEEEEEEALHTRNLCKATSVRRKSRYTHSQVTNKRQVDNTTWEAVKPQRHDE